MSGSKEYQVNMDIATQRCQLESHRYASALGHKSEDSEYSQRYNGYYAGYMNNIAELESLRAILFRLEGKKEAKKIAAKVDTFSLDDLI